jgi:hypothetical protein
VTLPYASNGGVTGHLSERFEVVRQQERSPTGPCSREGGLGTGVSTANDDHFKPTLEFHENSDDWNAPVRRGETAWMTMPSF